MVNKIAYINGKGGCGKTTSIFHTAGVLSKEGEKVLVIDLDKQRNTTDTLLMNTEKPIYTVLDFMRGEKTGKEVIGQSLFQVRGNSKFKYYNVDCMVSDVNLQDEAEIRKINAEKFGEELNAFIEEKGYTWVLIDMPPSNLALNEICFKYIVDYVITPFSSDIFSISGYGDIMNIIQEARTLNPSLNILGVYLSRYVKNCAVDKYIREQLLEFDTFIDIQIPLATDIRESILFGRPISYYKKVSNSKTAYETLVSEIRQRIEATR